MLVNALTLAILTTSAFFIVYKRLPRKIRRYIERHSLFADAFALLLTYMLLGGTLTALVAGALVGLMTSALLYVANNKEDFRYLDVIAKVIGEQLGKLKAMLKEFGEEYNRNHPELCKEEN